MVDFDPNILTSIDFWKNNLALALTGITMSFVGTIGYKEWKTAFISNFGSSKRNMKNKYEAVLIFNGSLLVMAILTFIINVACVEITNFFTLGQVIAVVISSSVIAVNALVKTWRQDDNKSMRMHGTAVVIFILSSI